MQLAALRVSAFLENVYAHDLSVVQELKGGKILLMSSSGSSPSATTPWLCPG